MLSREEIVEAFREYVVPGVQTYYRDPLVLAKGEGLYVEDLEGRRYLDFFGGILTVSVGHAHPKVTAAVSEQIGELVHTSTCYLTEPMVRLAMRLAEITPGRLKLSFFTNSGTEANETAILMAKVHTGSREVIAFRHGYSGRSAYAMSLTGQAPWKMGLADGQNVVHAHNAYCYRCPFGQTYGRCGLECAKDLEELIRTSTSGRPAAVLAEPIQGVGGFITPPPEFLYEVARIVRKYGGLFISDEVQTGFGRTGRMFGIEHAGVEPDIMTFAKGLANGYAVGATIATEEVGRDFRGPTIATFGGNPVSMRAALATLEVIEEERLVDNCRVEGEHLRAGLEELQRRYRIIGDVRGMGLMQGLEIVRDPETKEPAPELVLELFEATRARGLLIGKGGLYGNVIRLSPPMTVGRGEVDEALRVLAESFDEVVRAHPDLAA